MTFLSEPLSLPHKLFLVVIGGMILIYDFLSGLTACFLVAPLTAIYQKRAVFYF